MDINKHLELTSFIQDKTGIRPEQMVVLMKFGSHLYGTDGPDSDTDYKGIYLPSNEDMLLCRTKKSTSYHTKKTKEEGVKNSKDDIDIEIFSIQQFIKIACEGQTIALDMLHAPIDWPEISTTMWLDIRSQRQRFYTRSLSTFIDYARKQAAKYGIKGSRLDTLKDVIEFLSQKDGILKNLWGELPQGEHIHFRMTEPLPMYQVCGKSFQWTCKASYVLEILEKEYEKYGERARLAQQNKGVDWKAMSHALRAATQTLAILSYGGFEYPLRNTEYLKAVKNGKRDFTEVSELLQGYMEVCEVQCSISEYPRKVDRTYWDAWLIDKLSKNFCFDNHACDKGV